MAFEKKIINGKEYHKITAFTTFEDTVKERKGANDAANRAAKTHRLNGWFARVVPFKRKYPNGTSGMVYAVYRRPNPKKTQRYIW